MIHQGCQEQPNWKQNPYEERYNIAKDTKDRWANDRQKGFLHIRWMTQKQPNGERQWEEIKDLYLKVCLLEISVSNWCS